MFTAHAQNAESNAELKGLDVDSLVIEYIQINHLPRYGTHMVPLMVRQPIHELSLPH